MANALSALASLGFEGLNVDDLHKLSKADKFDEELLVMAEVSAYCRIAHKVCYLFSCSTQFLRSLPVAAHHR